MRVRQFVIALAAAALGSAATAEPPKAPVRNAGQPAQAQPPVVVASAEQVRTPAPVAEAQAQAEAPAPAKRVRTARVSSCRCGGQTPSGN